MEKKKEILKEALANLPVYVPDHSNWVALEEKLESEQISLRTAQVHEIDPPDFIWDHIDNELNLQEKTSRFPDYTPPASVWNLLDNQLTLVNLESRNKKRVWLSIWIPTLAAALLIVGFFLFYNAQRSDNANAATKSSANWNPKHI